MKNKINFISGETYTLAEFFSGNYKIIIPDLQRDFCWGDDNHTAEKKELVSDFVNNLIEQFEDSKDVLNLGLIYGYEVPTNHIQLCDGQQRITTLFLLLGMLNKKTDNKFRKHLISDFEYKEDDREPYLQYAIRESSLYFLSDLVCHFFINEEGDKEHTNEVGDIRKSTWFFNEYNLDPTINSIIHALKKIEAILEHKDNKWCFKFGEFLTSKLTLMYYDMENRKNGEETFVVINTTGEPLSNTQNLKASIQKINYEEWEEIETWFWKNCLNENGNDTADAGFNEFLRWVTMLNSDKDTLKEILATGIYVFPKEKINFDEIKSYFKQVKFLFEQWEKKDKLSKDYLSPKKNNNDLRVISQIDCFRLLPLITYCKNHKVTNNDRNLLRLYKFVNNLTRINRVGKVVNDLVYEIINMANKHEDIIELLEDNDISETILSNEERLKLSILKNNTNRDEIEEAFWKAQDDKVGSHKLWSGEILPLIEWSIQDTSNPKTFDINTFNRYTKRFNEVFTNKEKADLDSLRRALLTCDLKEYPKVFRGNTNYSFCYEWSDWHTLIFEKKDKFKLLFDKLESGETYEQMINDYSDTGNEFYDFVKKDYLLKYCEQKNIQWEENEGWLLIKRQRATYYTSVYNMHLSHYLSSITLPNTKIECEYNFVKVSHNDDVFYIRYSDNKWNFYETEEDIRQNEKPSDTIDFEGKERYNYSEVLESKFLKKIT